MSVEDSESRRFELNIRLSFSQANLGPTSAQELFIVFFLESLELFFPRFVLIASGTEMLWRVPFESESFLRQYRVPIAIGLLITAPFLFFLVTFRRYFVCTYSYMGSSTLMYVRCIVFILVHCCTLHECAACFICGTGWM